MSDRKKLIEKISKILAKAEGTNNEAEANIFMEKVHTLLEEHNISLHELGDADDPIHKSPDELEVSRSLSYCSSLIPWLGAYYGCEVTWQRTQKKFYFTVFGRQSATMTFHIMAPFVLKQVRQQAKKIYDEGLSPTYGKALTAVANALTHRLTRMWLEEQDREKSRVASGDRALVPVDQVKALVDETFGELKSNDRYPSKTTRAARHAADKIGVNRQTSSDSVKGLLT